jgi:integrase
LPYFGGRTRLASITAARVWEYVAHRQEQVFVARQARQIRTAGGRRDEPAIFRTPSNAEINRELTVLKRMFSLAIKGEKLLHKPPIEMLKERAPRAGFFEREQFETLRAHLPAIYRGLVTLMYITGWRMSEVTGLEWARVDFLGRTLWLHQGTTKGGEGRVFPFTRELEAVLLAQRDATRDLQRHGIITPWVFHRADGSRIRGFRKAWIAACRA